MSLFRTKTFWSNQCSNDEEYDQSSLKVSRINGDSDFILIGSHSGFLRIYKPTGPAVGENAFYRPNDLYLEAHLGDGILQIDVGRLVSGSQTKQIAILFPGSIGIYNLLSKDGIAEHGNQNALNLVYEHKLRRSAANFTLGPFGGVQNRDFLCVQSLDGMLSFFEQETFNFCCFLPDFLLPSPIVYVKSFDIFVTVASDWGLKSYKYKALSESGANDLNHAEKSTNNLESLWQYNLGEGVIDIQTSYDDISRQSHIAVLGERNLYCFNDYRLRFMRKLDFLPQCFLFYYLDDGKCMFLVIAETNTLLLYQGSTLKWSAKLEFLPIAVGRAFFNEINGALVMLSENGYLQLAYLGTEPNLFSAPPLKNQEIDFDKVRDELATLDKIIRSTQSNDLINTNAEKELVITISVTPCIENVADDHTSNRPCSSATIEIIPNAIFEEVHLSVIAQKPLVVNPPSCYYNNLIETTKFTCFVYTGSSYVIPSLELEVTVSFITNLGVPRICSRKANVPLRRLYESCAPMKDNQHKITLNLNRNSVPLMELFPEYVGENSLSASSNAIGLKHFAPNSPAVSILAAKSSKRYRIQSDEIVCLNLLVREVITRLKENYKSDPDFTITYDSQLPIQESLKYIRDHFDIVQEVTTLQNELNLLSSQYRTIQKRLVAKFKQKNPTPLSNLDILLQNTFEDINSTITNLKDAKNKLTNSQTSLSCVLNLLNSLVNLMTVGDDEKNADVFKTALLPNVRDYENQNWEDIEDASLCFLLRTCLAKSEKDKLRAPHTSFEEVKDFGKLEKHFIQVLERVSKKIVAEDDINDEVGPANEETTPAEEFVKLDETSEIGTEFATASTRALSARRSLLTRRYKVDE